MPEMEPKSDRPCRCNGAFLAARYPHGPHSMQEHEALLREQMGEATLPYSWTPERIDFEASVNRAKENPSYFAIDASSKFSSCPTCGAEEHEDCLDLRSKTGKRNAWVHPERFDGCLRYHGLTPDVVTGEESKRIAAIKRWLETCDPTVTPAERRRAERDAQEDAFAWHMGESIR